MPNTMEGGVWVWSCCWCRDISGNYRSFGMTVEILSCPECGHGRWDSCYVGWVKIHSPTPGTSRSLPSTFESTSSAPTASNISSPPPSRRGTASPQSGSNLESRGAARSIRVRGTGGGHDGGLDEQSEVVTGSMVDSTALTTSSQFVQASESAGSGPDLILPGTATPKLQKSGVEGVDTDQGDLRFIDTRFENRHIKTETMEVETEFNSNICKCHGSFWKLEKPEPLFQISHRIGNNEVENKQSSPLELFVINPTSYSEEITVLELRILQLGQNTFKNIEQDYMAKRRIIPLRKLDFGLEPSIPFSLSFDQRAKINGYIKVQILASIETLSSILGGTQLLQNEGFSNSSSYNIIVADIDRPNVLNIRPVSIPILNLLLKLLHEVNSCNQQRDMVLEDEADYYPTFLPHLDISGYTPSGSLSGGLHIESHGGTLFLGARPLNDLVKHQVWVLSFISENSKNWNVDYDGFYVSSSSIDDLAELWGPFRLNYAKDTKTAILKSIEIRGGRFIAIELKNCQVQPLNDETPCHWSTWLEISRDQYKLKEVEAIDTTKRLLIGMYSLDGTGSRLNGTDCQGQKRRRRPKLEVLERCMCKERYALKYGEFDLSTRAPSWKLDARTFQASGDQYFTVTVGFTYKFDAGWTLKDAILESWIDAGKNDSSHIPDPHYMDYLVVLDISHCSSHARRISLWKLFQYSDLRGYFRRNLEMGICQEIESVLLQHSSDDCFVTIWPTLDADKRNFLTLAFTFVLKTLRCTGVGQGGLLQVWDITTIPRIDGRRIDPRWSSRS
ncbi:hypothetical protein EAF04_009318 [Stromatinia cepivora]|nr:hypothetical protein EAF04_009318 [Stromatinia cepivora]